MKPGYLTTEFWLTFIAQLVNALVQSGLIGDGTQLVKALSFAAAALTTVVYAITRAQLKTAAGDVTNGSAPVGATRTSEGGSTRIDTLLILAMGVCIIGSIVSCAWLKGESKQVAHDVVDCTTSEAKSTIKQFGPTLDDVLTTATAADGSVDKDRIKSAARGFATDTARCVLADAVLRALTPKAPDPNAPKSSPLEANPDELRAAFAELGGGKRFKTEHGVL